MPRIKLKNNIERHVVHGPSGMRAEPGDTWDFPDAAVRPEWAGWLQGEIDRGGIYVLSETAPGVSAATLIDALPERRQGRGVS